MDTISWNCDFIFNEKYGNTLMAVIPNDGRFIDCYQALDFRFHVIICKIMNNSLGLIYLI